MLEIGIICIIVLAVGYWVTLWLMGRHDDVLHGDFVHPDRAGGVKSVFPAKPLVTKAAVDMPPVRKPITANRVASQALPAATPSTDRSDTLQSLLASIKRDLKDASQL